MLKAPHQNSLLASFGNAVKLCFSFCELVGLTFGLAIANKSLSTVFLPKAWSLIWLTTSMKSSLHPPKVITDWYGYVTNGCWRKAEHTNRDIYKNNYKHYCFFACFFVCFLKKLILLFTKDVLNWSSKSNSKDFYIVRKCSISNKCCSFEFSVH